VDLISILYRCMYVMWRGMRRRCSRCPTLGFTCAAGRRDRGHRALARHAHKKRARFLDAPAASGASHVGHAWVRVDTIARFVCMVLGFLTCLMSILYDGAHVLPARSGVDLVWYEPCTEMLCFFSFGKDIFCSGVNPLRRCCAPPCSDRVCAGMVPTVCRDDVRLPVRKRCLLF
jgi:hypothetical protein